MVRKLNSTYRSREYLTIGEIDRLLAAALYTGRQRVRNHLLVLLGWRHGLRRSELAGLRWDAIDFENGAMAIQRVKGSESGVHPLQPDELTQLAKLQQLSQVTRSRGEIQRHLFISERGEPLAAESVSRTLERIALRCDPALPLPFHAHMLRHSCGYWLANQGCDTRLIQDWLGHRNIEHTVRYTKLNPDRFKVIRWS
jgi:type 1 fimbriae regulatory protein FimB